MTAVTVSSRQMFAQGDYVICNGRRSMRVTATKGDTMTVRWVHSWAWIEWLNARLESWIAWPLQRLWRTARSTDAECTGGNHARVP